MRLLWYGRIRHWRGLRVQACPECGEAERGFRLSEPPPPPTNPRHFAARGPDPRTRQNWDVPPPPPDDTTGTYFRSPERSILRFEWVSCVVCGAIIDSTNPRRSSSIRWPLSAGQRPTAVPRRGRDNTESTCDQVAEGQPVLLVRNGRPAAVIVDLESWEEAELAVTQSA